MGVKVTLKPPLLFCDILKLAFDKPEIKLEVSKYSKKGVDQLIEKLSDLTFTKFLTETSTETFDPSVPDTEDVEIMTESTRADSNLTLGDVVFVALVGRKKRRKIPVSQKCCFTRVMECGL